MASASLGAALRRVDRLIVEGAVADLPDGELLGRFVSGRDERAFEALVIRHGPMVLATCRAVLGDPHEAEDAFQATFVALVRRASTIRAGDSLGGWLHRVARRSAARAGAESSRRRDRERQVPPPEAAGPAPDDLRAIVHAEVDRLPDVYRLPVVLCDLEGLTKGQAAHHLGWTEGALRGRLDKARKLLRSRLDRRGLAPSAVLPVLASSAQVPARWVEGAVRAAVGFVSPAGVGLGFVFSRGLGSLGTRMAVGFVFPGWVIAVAVGFVLAGVVVGFSPARRAAIGFVFPPGSAPENRPAVAAPKGESVEVAGLVLDPDGRPVPGASIGYHSPRFDDPDQFPEPVEPRATTDADGRFRFAIPRSDLGELTEQARWDDPTVAASMAGFGPGWARVARPGDIAELTLRLVRDDVPIVGRVVDLEGRPVAGVRVRPMHLMASADEDLSAWLKAIEAGDVDPGRGPFALLRLRLDRHLFRIPPAVTTGADGRFRLDGIGRERIVELRFDGPTIAHDDAFVRTRPGPTLRFARNPEYQDFRNFIVHGATFDHVAAPTRPVEGIVRDRETGRPIAGATVGDGHAEARTDAEGRYRLLGLPDGKGRRVTVTPPQGAIYPPIEAEIPDGSGLDPIRLDLAPRRGVLIRGKVADRATGRPVPARVEYFAFLDNPHLRDFPGLAGPSQGVATAPDGSFALVGLPGRGLLAARASEDRFVAGSGSETIPDEKSQDTFLPTAPNSVIADEYHTLAVVEPADGATTFTRDLPLDPGRTMAGTVVDPDGHPLDGTTARGLRGIAWTPPAPLPAGRFEATALDPNRPRLLTFRHAARNLGAVAMARGDEPQPFVVRMEPCATAVGRLVDADGHPRAGLLLRGGKDAGQLGQTLDSAADFAIKTDPDGRFRVEGLIPGVRYSMYIPAKEGSGGHAFRGRAFRPGETVDLGDVRAVRLGP